MDQTPQSQVSEVRFNEPIATNRAPVSKKLSIGMWFVKAGIAKDADEAQKMLIVITVFALIAMVLIWIFAFPKDSSQGAGEPVGLNVTSNYV